MLAVYLVALASLSVQVEQDAATRDRAAKDIEPIAAAPSGAESDVAEPPPAAQPTDTSKSAAPAPNAAKPRLVVTDLIAERGLDAGLVRLLNEMMLTELSDQSDYIVIGGSDIKALHDDEAQRQMLGNCDETSCLAELGGALDAQVIVSANIGVVGERYLINLKMIDVAQNRVVRRVSRTTAADERMLLPEMRSAVHELAKGKASAAPREEPLPVAANAAAVDDGANAGDPSVLSLALLGAGGVAAALGAIVLFGGGLSAAGAQATLLDKTADPSLRTTALSLGAPALFLALGGGVVVLIGVGVAAAGGAMIAGGVE
jgi:hypothetical protein